MKYKLSIQGMHCSSCAVNIERVLKGIKGVKDVRASVITNKVFVDAENGIPEEEMKNSVVRIGYKVINVEGG